MAEKMFMRGEKRKGERSSAGIMLEKMLKRARKEKPRRYDTPSLIEVSKLVSQMVTNTKQGRAARGSGGGKKKLEETHSEVQQLREAFDASGQTMMPAAAVAWLRAADCGWPEGVEEKTVKARVTAWRKEARDELLDGDEGDGG